MGSRTCRVDDDPHTLHCFIASLLPCRGVGTYPPCRFLAWALCHVSLCRETSRSTGWNTPRYSTLHYYGGRMSPVPPRFGGEKPMKSLITASANRDGCRNSGASGAGYPADAAGKLTACAERSSTAGPRTGVTVGGRGSRHTDSGKRKDHELGAGAERHGCRPVQGGRL